MSLLKTNLKAIDGNNMGRSDAIVKMWWMNMDKHYGYQMLAEKTSRGSNSVEKVNWRSLKVNWMFINQPIFTVKWSH